MNIKDFGRKQAKGTTNDSQHKTNFENILNSKKDIAMKPDTPVVMAMGQ
jgi:hypothetical protein